ncbi:MJ0042-type zinc finger domain-containing protein [Kingella negevensis]|nr:MJ0042-type zinc finger domain-containing protein [Kingella negevensis]MDK4688029.1 hypothetical protein [Kingella negevensis]WII90987.1 hypothetical protein QEO93_11395 [Kingella negevensis]
MHEIKCPHCQTAFTINEASYAGYFKSSSHARISCKNT